MRLTTTTTPGLSRVASGASKATAWTIVAVGLALTFLLDRFTYSAPVQHLYYLPIIVAALRLEWLGGLLTSLTAIGLYHLANPALLSFAYRESDFVQIALFIAVGLVTARLAENGRRLHAMAMTDDLTGLHNLRSFEGQLTTMIRTARTSGVPIWMLVLDLDRLKSLNDTYGHLTGAEAVRHVGHVLATQLPADAVACRYGGDEFAVCVVNRAEAEVRRIAERLCQSVHAGAPVLAGRPFPSGTLSISIGVGARESAHAHAGGTIEDDVEAGEALFRSADEALYGAKSRGRNQVFVARPAVPNHAATAGSSGA
ncbi:MAG: GGDEF domain-containing protein [Vicinamibacterales bacterium]